MTAPVMTPISPAQCPILYCNFRVIMHQVLTIWSQALPRKNLRRTTGSRTALISTRPLSSPSAGVFLQSVQLKIGKFMFLILILMVLIAIFYSILLQPASAVSSARECLGRLSRNGHLMDTIWSCLRRNHDNYDAVFGRGRVKNIYQAQCEFHCRMATEAGKLFIPFNIFA
jgi:hypothetical protein